MQQQQYLYLTKTHVLQNTTKDKGDNSRQSREISPTEKSSDSESYSGLLPNAILQTSRQNQRENGDQSKEESSTKTQARRQSI